MPGHAEAARITLADGASEVDIVPGKGAALARYDWVRGKSPVPIFLATPFGTGPDAMDVACIVLAPWSNRISGGGFSHAGRFVALAPNLPGETFPIHGNAFQCAWTVDEVTASSASLSLDSDGPGEFRYTAKLNYRLEGGALTLALGIVNRAKHDLPFGLGVHPWLPRTPETELQFDAEGVWLEDDSHLPSGHIPIAAAPLWEFGKSRPLPSNWINNAFSGWDRSARVVWRDRALALGVESSQALSTCIVYSPDRDADFFCFEPVTHPVDAHNMDKGAQTGLAILAPGDALETWTRFSPEPLA